VQRAADLIKQTLYLTRQTAPTLQRVDLSGLVEEMSRSAAANENWNLQVELALQERLAPASIDPRHVSHVFEELCRKAVDGMGVGAQLRLSTRGVAGSALQERFSEEGRVWCTRIRRLRSRQVDTGK
jgi:signal transduction histidine kinase